MGLTVPSGGLIVFERGDDWDIAFDYAPLGKLPPGASVVSAQFFASLLVKPLPTTVLVAEASAGALSIVVAAPMVAGARLLLEPDSPRQDEALVSQVQGTVLTIVPGLWQSHGPQAPIEYEPGLTPAVLGAASSVASGNQVAVHIRPPGPGQLCRVTC